MARRTLVLIVASWPLCTRAWSASPALAPRRATPAAPRWVALRASESKPDEPEPEGDEPADLDGEFERGLDFGRSIRARFVAPTVDDPGLPSADALVIVCGAVFVAALGLKGIIPRPSWLVPSDLSAIGLDVRGLPYIWPALSHGAALGGCWLPGALAASAYERGAFSGSLSEAIRRTWKAGAFATGVLLLCTQASLAADLQAAGIDQYVPSAALDARLNNAAGELLSDVVVQCGGLTAFRAFRWADARGAQGGGPGDGAGG